MEIQIQELIDKIKKDGIETAGEEAARVKAEAEAKARQIVEAAQKEAEGIVSRGKQDAERFEKAGVAALEQASRNLILAFKGEIQALLDKIVGAQVNASYGDDVLKAILPEIIKSWTAKGQDKLDLLLSQNDLSKLEGFFKDKLAEQLKGGVELKSNRSLDRGFRISSDNGSVYFDFSAEAVSELISAYLNPRLAEILKSSVKGQ